MSLQRTLSILRSPLMCQRCLQFNSPKIRNFSVSSSLFLPKSARDVSTYELTNEAPQESLLKRMLNKIPLSFNKNKLKASGYFLYEGIVDNINHLDFFDEFGLHDTFYSWFVITELHVWMLSARVMAEGEEGRILRNSIVEALWRDVQQRTKKLGAGNPTEIRTQISELSEQLQAALISYDEGILSDDVVLAGALWRRIFQYGLFQPEKLELLVNYVRKQMYYLDRLSKHKLLFEAHVQWKPLRVRS